MRRMARLHFLRALLVVSALLHGSNASFSLSVKGGDEECFVIQTPKEGTSIISGSFDCLDEDAEGKEFSVTFSMLDKGKTMYQSDKNDVEGSFKITTELVDTKFALCFQNHNQDDDSEENILDIGFNLHVTSTPRSLENGLMGPDTERAFHLVEKAAEIHQDWSAMMDHLDFARGREAIHQEMHSSILTRLSRWTYLEALLVIGMATGQVMYWKNFFETRRYL